MNPSTNLITAEFIDVRRLRHFQKLLLCFLVAFEDFEKGFTSNLMKLASCFLICIFGKVFFY